MRRTKLPADRPPVTFAEGTAKLLQGAKGQRAATMLDAAAAEILSDPTLLADPEVRVFVRHLMERAATLRGPSGRA